MRGNEHKKEKNNKVTQSAEENEHFDANGMEEGEEEEEEEDGAVDDDKDDESFHPPDKTCKLVSFPYQFPQRCTNSSQRIAAFIWDSRV